MRAFAIITVLCVCIFAPAASADEDWEVVADSTLSGNPGFVVKINDTGVETVSLFVFQEGAMIRLYAERPGGSDVWDVLPGAQYICPATTMNISDTWRFVDSDLGLERVATVVAQESITTAAGTFSCYRVNIELVANPGVVVQSLWFSSGVGIIRQTDDNPVTWQADLSSRFLAGGSGFLPLSTGNIWQYAEIATPVETRSWGAVKSLYAQ